MQRLIKFRAWDKEQKRLVYDFETTPYFNSRVITKYSVKDCMQYTGLKDKNGVEIYEGDVVEMHYFSEGLTSEFGVFEKDNAIVGEVVYDNSQACFSVKHGLVGYPIANYLEQPSEEIEVIGNIYEHSHLLEANQ